MGFSVVRVGMVAAMLGCQAAPTRRPLVEPETILIAELLAAPIRVVLAQPAASYDEPRDAVASTPLADAVRAAMQDAAGSRAEITADPRLDTACREIAKLASRDAAPRAALIELVLQGLGIVEPADRVLVAWDVETPEQAVGALRPQFGDALVGYLRAGVAAAPGGPVIAIVVRAAGVVFASLPRAVPARDGFELVATLAPRLTDPHVTITRDDGSLEYPDVELGDEGTFRARFECGEHRGRQWISVDANSRLSGRLTRAQVPILCGDRPPSSFELEPAANLAGLATAADVERRLTSIINRERVRAHLPPLRTDLRVARSAREHSERVRDGRASDGEPASPTERLRTVGVSPRVLFENLLEVDSVGQAAEELMNHAVYRARVESEDVTEVGVGVAIDDASHRLRVTVTYVLLPPPIDEVAVARRLTVAINAVAESTTSPELANIAQHYASGLALGWRREHLWPRIYGELHMLPRGYAKIGNAVVSVVDVSRIDVRDLVRGRPARKIGVGVAQSARYGPQGGVVWVVVFLTERVASWPLF